MCNYMAGYAGKCKNSGEPFCDEHKKIKCDVCGKQAVRECCTGTSVICGYPLCEKCECKRHYPIGDPGVFIRRRVSDLTFRAGDIVQDFFNGEISKTLETLKILSDNDRGLFSLNLHSRKTLTLRVELSFDDKHLFSMQKHFIKKLKED